MAQSQVKMYCEPELNERVKRAAKKDGRSVSKWLIKAAEEKMSRERTART